MDPISAMLGLDIDDEEKTRALADRLRGRKSAADFFSLSTIKPISRMAIAEQGDVMDSAKTAGGLRRARAARDAAAQLQQDSIAARVTAADVKEGRRQAALTAEQDYDADLLGKQRSYDEGMADYDTYINPDDQATINVRQQGGGLVDSLGAPADISGMMPIGDYDAPDASAGYSQASTRAERDKEVSGGENFSKLMDSVNTYEDAFEPTIPFLGKLENTLASYTPLGTDTTERQADWWKGWKRNNELVQRHELFGSALTASEQAEWAASSIDPNTNAERVREFLKVREKLARKVAEADVVRQLERGRNPKEIMLNYGDTVNIPTLVGSLEDGSYWTDLERRQEESRAQNRGVDRATVPGMDSLDAQIQALEAELGQ